MLGFFIGLLTAVIVIDCLLLILLVLIQLPKKEAGVGVAFGGAATDALFGAGSGTALTKITKYAAGVFLAGTLVLSVLHANASASKRKGLEEELRKASSRPASQVVTPAVPTNMAAPALLTNITTNAAAPVATPKAAPVTNTPAAR